LCVCGENIDPLFSLVRADDPTLDLIPRTSKIN
jgi:hypothetical protein